MSIETVCAGCNLKLRVGDEHQGKQARCPVCGHIYTIPVVPAQGARFARPATSEAAAGGITTFRADETSPVAACTAVCDAGRRPGLWRMKTPEGQVYGPVTRAELDRWMSEGRIAGDCDLRRDGDGWIAADQVYPSLRPAMAAASSSPPAVVHPSPYSPVAGRFAYDRVPGANEVRQAGLSNQGYALGSSGSVWRLPHRGGFVLGLGVTGLVFGLLLGCPVFSVMAWVIGSGDLREIREGRRDDAGYSTTRAGQVLGMVVSLFWVVLCLILVFFFLLSAAANA